MPTGSASTPYTNPQTPQQSYDKFIDAYRSRIGQNKSGENYRALGNSGALAQGTVGIPTEMVGLNNLYQMLLGQGRVDPRLLASAQARNARATQQQRDQAMRRGASTGFGRSGLGAALSSAIDSSGRNTAANLEYQDISDSYARNQQNLGLLDQLVIQPQLQYAGLGIADVANSNQLKAAKIGGYASLLGGAARAVGGG